MTAIGARRKERFTDPPIELLSRCLSTQTDGYTSISDASTLEAIASYYQHLSPEVCNRNMVVVEIDEPVSYDQYRRSESSSYNTS
jgi:diphthamide biosynthesis methyltransferase